MQLAKALVASSAAVLIGDAMPLIKKGWHRKNVILMCAKTFGELKHSYTVFFGEARGNLSVYEDGLELDGARKIMAGKSYVIGIEREGGSALNRCVVKLDYYDIFGNKNSVSFLMHEDDLRSLKKDLGK